MSKRIFITDKEVAAVAECSVASISRFANGFVRGGYERKTAATETANLKDAKPISITGMRRWNPKMARFIFTERNGIYIIDLQKTVKKMDEAYNFVRDLAAAVGKDLALPAVIHPYPVPVHFSSCLVLATLLRTALPKFVLGNADHLPD